MDNGTVFKIGGCALYAVGIADLKIGDKVLESQENANYEASVENSVKKTIAILKEAGIEPMDCADGKVGIFFGYGEEDKVYSLTSILDYLNRVMHATLPFVKNDRSGVIDPGNKE